MAKKNKANASQESDCIVIDQASYSDIATNMENAKQLLADLVDIHAKIETDLQWEGDARKSYDSTKAFIDMYMRDFPIVYETLTDQVGNIVESLEILFSEELKAVSDFYNYED